MKMIRNIVKSDWNHISHNVVALLVLIGLAVIPSLYAWFNILSNWDPYGSDATSRMQIAVYSSDEGVHIDSFGLCIGDVIVENLHTNHTIGWVFSESREEALEGVYSGDYYAALIIPDNFTEDMISFMGGEIENPKIQYYENSKKNAIATKITSKVKTSIQQEVNASLVRTLAESMSEVGKTLAGEDKGESTYYTMLNRLEDADSGLTLYINLLDSFVNLTGNAGELLNQTGKIVPDVYDIASRGSASLEGALESAAASSDVVNAMGLLLDRNLSNAITSLEKLNKQLNQTDFRTDFTDAVHEYNTDLPDRSDGFDNAIDAVENLEEKVNRLPEELPIPEDPVPDLSEKLPDAPDLPELPDNGNLPNLPDVPNQVELPDIPNLPEELPDMPDNPIVPDWPTDVDWSAISREYADTLQQVKTILLATEKILGDSKAEYQYVLRKYEELQEEVDALAMHGDMTGADADAIRAKLAQTTSEMLTGLHKLKTSLDDSVLPDLREKTENAYTDIRDVKETLDGVQGNYDVLQNALDAYGVAVMGSKEGIGESLKYLKSMERALRTLIRELRSLSEDEQYSVIMDLLDNSTEEIAGFITSPVELVTTTFYEIENNGSAMAPFYTVLALWVGALLLVAMIHTGIKPNALVSGARFYERFMGRYVLFFIIAEIQSLITSLGVLYFVGIQCLHPARFVLGCMIISFCFSLIMYSLTYGMGNLGEGAAVIILVLQVAGGGGTFPIEVLPKLYQLIYRFLPFPYALDIIKETVGGMYGNLYSMNIGILVLYSIIIALVCLILERVTRRSRAMLDKSKKATGVMK